MRKVTERAAQALKNGYNYKSGNTAVISNGNVMNLHDNTIAIYDRIEQKLTLRDCGWQTVTTKERLNGILQAFGIQYVIYQHKGNWIIESSKLGRERSEAWQGFAVFDVSRGDL